MRTEEGKLHLFVGIDRTSKFVFAKLVQEANRVTASVFLVELIAAVPYKIHTVLTDNGIQFTFPPRSADGPTACYMMHMFDIGLRDAMRPGLLLRCRENGIEYRLTKPNHPERTFIVSDKRSLGTNGQVERMNRTLKETTVRRYHYDSHDQLRQHLKNSAAAYNFAAGFCLVVTMCY